MKKILTVVLLAIAGFLGYVALQPADYVIHRELAIQATPELIFPHLNNSKLADDWMPWHEMDPEMTMEYSGPDEGVGSTSKWVSKGQMGTGSAVVVESVPNAMVRTQLTYFEPMEMSQLAELSTYPSSRRCDYGS